jgi:hypothetical protein
MQLKNGRQCSGKRGDGSSDASNALHGWPSRSLGQNRLLWSSNPMLLFEARGTPLPDSHRERAPIQHQPRLTFTPQTQAPGTFRFKPPPLQQPSPVPSPAARAQKQSRTQEAPASVATHCRLLEASNSPSTSRVSHAHPPG